MAAIAVENLRKQFTVKSGPMFKKKKTVLDAVDDVSFSIQEGEIFSLLGPNGAGKTTIIKILATLLIPTDGMAKVQDYNVVKDDFEVRKILTAVLPGERTLYWKLTVRENLLYFGSLYGMSKKTMQPRIDELLNEFAIDEKRDTLVEKLSTGQRQKAVLCRAMLPRPKVLLLDEPTLGLDPVAAKGLRNTIRAIQASGTTLLLTTHYMYEADELSDRVAIIDNGKIECLDTPDALKGSLNIKKIFRLETDRWDDDVSRQFGGEYRQAAIRQISKNGHVKVTIEVADSNLSLADVSGFCSANKITVHQVNIDEPTLEDVFVEKTGKRIEESEAGDADTVLA